jgi:outer membrane receptor protein involved in Fe transport
VIENAPEANIKGLETAVNWNATRQLAVNGGFTLTQAQLTKNFCGTDQSTGQLISSCASAAAVAPSGAPLPYTPDFKGFASARYTAAVLDWQAFGQGTVSYQTLSHVGLRSSDNAELGTMPAYATVDVSAGAERNRLSFELFVKNLFDSRGQENRYTDCPVQLCSMTLPGVPHSVFVVPIVPRTIGVRVRQSF